MGRSSLVSVSSYRGETLKLQGSRSEMGSYLCISSNGVPPSISKRISLTVQCECRSEFGFAFNYISE